MENSRSVRLAAGTVAAVADLSTTVKVAEADTPPAIKKRPLGPKKYGLTNKTLALREFLNMRFPSLVWILWLAGATSLCGQRTSFQQREELSVEQRVVVLEEQLAARSEDVKNLLSDVDALKGELKTVREQAKSAEDLSKSNQDRVDQISGIGRMILGAVAFLIGAIVTQFVSKIMSVRRPRIVEP
jgi:hypothetical protein